MKIMRNLLLNAFWRRCHVSSRSGLLNPSVVRTSLCRKTVGFRFFSAAEKKPEPKASEEKKHCNVGTIGHVDHGEFSSFLSSIL